VCLAPRDEDGKVITAPINFQIKKIKKGSLDAVLFDKKPSYVTVGKLQKNLIVSLI
jgi:hypothetical protein